MSGIMGNRNIRRGAASVLALALTLAVTACGTFRVPRGEGESAWQKTGAAESGAAETRAAETGAANEPVQGKAAYSQRHYEHFDPSAMERAMADFEKACALKGQDQEVRRLYGVIVGEFDRLATMSYMAQVAYDQNVSDEAAAAEQAYTTQLYNELGDKALRCLKKGMDSSYKELLTQQAGKEYAPFIEHYREASQEITDLNQREQKLLQEYDRLAAGDITVELEDGQWSYSRLERENDLSAERYDEVEEALVREKNKVFGEMYIELAGIRHQIAEGKGYDSYAEYAFEALYGRDYSLKDARKLCSNVREQIVPLNDDIWYKDIAQSSYDALDELEDSSAEDILDTTGLAVEKVDPGLGDVFRYMRQNGLYDIRQAEEGEDRIDSSYTVGMPEYGDAFIFINRSGTFMDYQSVIHEFGHFSSHYYDTVPELFQGFSVDVCEIQSQGLEMLTDRYVKDMFGGGASAYEFESITDMLYVAIMSCMLQEFEEAVYTEPGMSLDAMNRRFKEIQDSYGAWYYDIYDGDECYDWVDISHLFYSPMYYMGYGTSALSSLDLWAMSQEDWDGAVETYMGILKAGMDAPYRETMDQWGFRDVFDSGELESLAGDVRRLQGLENADGENGNAEDAGDAGNAGNTGDTRRPGVEESGSSGQKNSYGNQTMVDVLALAGIGTIIVLQVMILCVGFAILWVILKKKKDS